MSARHTFCLVWFAVLGCKDDASPRFFTPHLVVEPSEGEQVCLGTLDAMEAQVVRVADRLRLDIPSPILVYFGQPAVDEKCNAYSDYNLGGCARGSNEQTYVATGSSSAYHELVHAVRLANGDKASRFFEEGIAVVLSGVAPFPVTIEVDAASISAEEGPETLSKVAWGDFRPNDYLIAAHFMSWLITTYGDDTVAAFLGDERAAVAVDDAFTDHFGLDLRESEAAWRSDSEPVYRWGQTCDPERALDWDGETLTYNGRLECDDPWVSGPGADTITVRSACFPVENPVVVRLELRASAGEVTLRHQEDCLAGGPLTQEYYQDKLVRAGETIDAVLAPCTWEVRVSTSVTSETGFELSISR